MDALAAEAFLNAQHRVYGLRLLPLSVGHAFVLEALGSPFFHGKCGTPSQLRMAAWLCSRPPLTIPNMDTFAVGFWKWRTRYSSFLKECENWQSYVADYAAAPQMWSKTPKAGEKEIVPSRIPNTLTTVIRLMRLGMSESQAWATPVGVASWYEAAAFETETGNKLDIVTDAERLAILKQKTRKQNG